jgi:hypothetical protein
MANWTAQATANATSEQLLDVLTHPDEIRRWSPIDFDLENCDGRLAAGTRTRVTGRLAGVPVGFDVEVHEAGRDGLRLSADSPIGIDVRYDLCPGKAGAELNASVSLRNGRGLTGRIVANTTKALLSAGVLDSTAGRIVRAAEV